jgi:hypothetical protein
MKIIPKVRRIILAAIPAILSPRASYCYLNLIAYTYRFLIPDLYDDANQDNPSHQLCAAIRA